MVTCFCKVSKFYPYLQTFLAITFVLPIHWLRVSQSYHTPCPAHRCGMRGTKVGNGASGRSRAYFESKQTVLRVETDLTSSRSRLCFQSNHSLVGQHRPCGRTRLAQAERSVGYLLRVLWLSVCSPALRVMQSRSDGHAHAAIPGGTGDGRIHEGRIVGVLLVLDVA